MGTWLLRHRLTALLCFTITLLVASAAAAQTRTDPDRGRVGVMASYAGRGTDLEVSADTPLLANGVRLRGAVASGSWVNQWDASSLRSPGAPTVSRVTASILFIRRLPDPPHIAAARTEPSTVRAYIGGGIGMYFPHVDTLRAARGIHFVAGMEGSGTRWSLGPEISFDAPLGGRWLEQPPPPYFMTSMLRIGFAVRRRLR